MAAIDVTYNDLISKILKEGVNYEDPRRDGVIRKQISNYELKHDLTRSFPAITTKKLYWKGIVGELIWFLRGDTNIKYLLDNNIHIWDKDAYNKYLTMNAYSGQQPVNMKRFIELVKEESDWNDIADYEYGDLGPVYGAQWRGFESQMGNQGHSLVVDQFSRLISGMKLMPMATDHIVMAWNPGQTAAMALPPCHFGFIIEMRPLKPLDYHNLKDHMNNPGDMSKRPKYGFTLKWFQRSVDVFLGLPFNVASYALLAHIIGKITNTVPLEIVGSLSNVHLYDNTVKAAKTQLRRDPHKYQAPELEFDFPMHFYKTTNNVDDIFSRMQIKDFKLNNYNSYPAIKAEMLSRDE